MDYFRPSIKFTLTLSISIFALMLVGAAVLDVRANNIRSNEKDKCTIAGGVPLTYRGDGISRRIVCLRANAVLFMGK